MTVRELIEKLEAVCGEGSLMQDEVIFSLTGEDGGNIILHFPEVAHVGDAVEIELK